MPLPRTCSLAFLILCATFSERWPHRRPPRSLLLAHVAAQDCGCAYLFLVPVP